MMLITKTFYFNAGHRLKDHNGLCRNVHGHNYKCLVNLQAVNREEKGMGIDFQELHPIKKRLDENLDHAFIYEKGDHIGEFLQKEGLKVYELSSLPSTEFLAAHIYKKIELMGLPVFSIELRETPKCRVIYSP